MASRISIAIIAAALLTSAPLQVLAQFPTIDDGPTILTGSRTLSISELGTPTGTYVSVSTQLVLGSVTNPASSVGTGNATGATTGPDVTLITGSPPTTTATTVTGNGTVTLTSLGSGSTSPTATATSSSSAPAAPTNTKPCNGHPSFCARRYSNLTMVAAHNSPFVRAGNAAANQQLPVAQQLDDGVRLLQAQMQWPANASGAGMPAHFCHTSCDILDAGPIAEWLGQVRDWVAAHPYDVVTVLLGNGNYSDPALYAAAIEQSGIAAFAYAPPLFPMRLGDWPTLGEMVLRGRRVVMFLDYEADQARFPWLLDQFSQLWETPFDPQDASFPCLVQRPPDLPDPEARDARMYMANHNLNVEVKAFGATLLVPAVSVLNQTNAAEGNGSLGDAARGCRERWGRAPNFLNVDYYNFGPFPGSVFEVAAQMNGVGYQRGTCCGKPASSAASSTSGRNAWLVAVVGLAMGLLLL